MKYIDADRLKAEIESIALCPQMSADYNDGRDDIKMMVLDLIDSLQQEQPETDIKSPFTGGKVEIISGEVEVTFRGEKIKANRKYYRCVDTGREFTDGKLDEDMMWAVFRAYSKKKGMTSFTDIVLKQEPSEKTLTFGGFVDKVGTWFAHLRLDKFRKTFDGETFPATELVQRYDLFVRELAKQYSDKHKEPEVDLDREITHIWGKCAAEPNDQIACLHIESFIEIAHHFAEWGAIHFNARKEE